MNIEFPGKTVIVTGGAHGFGRAIAHAFAARGAWTWTCDVLADGLGETAAQARPAGGGRLETAIVDVTDRAAAGQLVDRVVQTTGQIDILVNNAGGVCGQVGQPIEDVAPAQWQVIFDVNVTGSFHFAQAVAPHMKAARAGRIVNISSGAGLGVSRTGIQAYAAAKAAQIGLTRQLAHELGPFGITVNSVAPGFVRSNPTTEWQWEAYGPEGQRRLVESIALRRLGAPADIAHAVLFLASDHASWITGQVVSVSGGP
ncbi:MAG: SDR family oxidoreductase [Deltaproteobacteria bacterium]|nr:MAG: SDR family oxidoreductase [Deltaproteobacteria bacterium]TMQ28674.1 MAG: SDR family oxidoreductase [Deltaproteobacteria bacterium]